MAGFFSLGSATYRDHSTQQQTDNNISSNPLPNSTPESSSWFLYSTSTTARNNHHDHHQTTTTTTKDFELWQQQPHPDAAFNLLAAGPAMGGGGGGSGGTGGGGGGGSRLINFADESSWGTAAFVMMGHGVSSGGSSSGGGVSCQDCGNQAKKDCTHMRCRSCCKSRGFECQTHVKSTWVPAAKRRERQQYLSTVQQDQHQVQLRQHHRLQPTPKRSRENNNNNNTSNMVNPISAAAAAASLAYNSSSGLEVGNFPAEVSTQANFKCVRVSSIDDADDQFAYQAAVNIGGHLFKGILYDQGPEGQYMAGETSSGGSAGGMPLLNLTASSPGNNSTNYSLYPSLSGNEYMAGTQFFHQIPRT